MKGNKQEMSVEQPALAPFIDIVFQLLIFFLLSMKFKATEGHLLSTLPRKGLDPAAVRDPDLHEIRVLICAGGPERHLGARESHQKDLLELKKSGGAVGDVAVLQVEHGPRRYEVYRPRKYPDRARENVRVYEQVAAHVAELHKMMRFSLDPGRRARVIIDCDGPVPYEHAFGVLNALRKHGISDIEWAANPRLQ